MNRRRALKMILTASASTPLLRHGKLFAQDATPERGAGIIYLHPAKGSDTNSGAEDSPLRTLAAAAKRVSESTDSNEVTIVLAEGVYAVGETAVFKPANRSFTKDKRLTIHAEVRPDDPDWNPGRMPTLIHTMPLSPDWNGRPDPFGGVAYGMMIETSHVTIQGLKILGMPVVEHPKQGVIQRVYPIGRNGRDLDDLEIKQCLFAGDEVTNPNHLGILANGSGIVVDHCIFYHLKQPIVYWSGGRRATQCETLWFTALMAAASGPPVLRTISSFGTTSSLIHFISGSPKAPGQREPKQGRPAQGPARTPARPSTTR